MLEWCAMPKPYLYFELTDTERQSEYRNLLGQHSTSIKKAAEYLLRAMQSISQVDDTLRAHGVVFLLARHAAEEIDAISVLVAEGCITPCKAHLRSVFEARMGVEYILTTDSERRAMAYYVKHAFDRLRVYDTLDSNTPKGADFQTAIQDDEIAKEVLSSLPPLDFDSMKADLRSILQTPPFDLITAEFERMANKRRPPAWYSLFGGPQSLRALASELKLRAWYDFMYSDWSGHVHAGSGLSNVGPNTNDPTGEILSIRPLRNPEGLSTVYSFAQGLALWLGEYIAKRYLRPRDQQLLQDFYSIEIQPIYKRLQTLTVMAKWK